MLEYNGETYIIDDVELAARFWASLFVLVVVLAVVAFLSFDRARAVKVVRPEIHVDFSRTDQVLELYGAQSMQLDSVRGVWLMKDASGAIVGVLDFTGGDQ